jgi:hypothetical protein
MIDDGSNQSDEYKEPLVKVFIELESTDWHNYKTESLWVRAIGGDLYQICNIPFYAMGLSYGDIIRATLVNGDLVFMDVARRDGHSTYRFFIMDGITDEQWLPYWQPLEELGCTYEKGTQHLFGVDVPAHVDVNRAYELLDAGEKAGVWGFQEAHCGHFTKQ